jgi:formate hydrogenlyase subunit 6/NADH:ubiquinone oxidoreductase subunit I
LQYRFAPFFKKEITSQQPPPVASQTANKATNSRRSFLAAGIKVAAALPAVSAFARHDGAENDKEAGLDYKHLPPVTPPGSGDLERFKDKCIGCHVCVARCPTQVLKPAGLQFGFGYLLRPHCSFKSSYCNYECTVCGEVCPTHAIRSLTKEEKKTTQVGIATFNIHKCIVYTEGTDCGACSEHCPTQAVHMVPYRGTQTIPKVEPELCIGCGGCESICPVKPHRAIVVKAHSVHQTIAPPPEEEAKEVEIKDFGF